MIENNTLVSAYVRVWWIFSILLGSFSLGLFSTVNGVKIGLIVFMCMVLFFVSLKGVSQATQMSSLISISFLFYPIYQAIYNIIVSQHPNWASLFSYLDRWPLIIFFAILIFSNRHKRSQLMLKNSHFFAWLFLGWCVLSAINVSLNQSIRVALSGLVVDASPILYFILGSAIGRIRAQNHSHDGMFKSIIALGSIVSVSAILIQRMGISGLNFLGLSLYYQNNIYTRDWGSIYGWGNFLRFTGSSFIVRAAGFLGSPLSLASWLTIVLIILIQSYGNMRKKWVFLIALLLISYAIYLTYTRSALVAIFVAILVLVTLNNRTRIRDVSVLFSVCFFTILLGFAENITTITSLFSENAYGGSLAAHLHLIPKYIGHLVVHPFGLGIGTVGIAAERAGVAQASSIEGWYFQISDELGLPGLFLYFGLYASIIVESVKLWKTSNDFTFRHIISVVIATAVALGVFNILLPIWSDQSTSILAWGYVFGFLPHSRSSDIDSTDISRICVMNKYDLNSVNINTTNLL